MRLETITFTTALALMIGYLLWIGQPIMLPVVVAIISLYVLSEAARSLRQVRIFRLAPEWMLRTLILLAFTVGLGTLFVLVVVNFGRVAAAIPGYESNLDALVARAAGLGVNVRPSAAVVPKTRKNPNPQHSLSCPPGIAAVALERLLLAALLWWHFH